MYYRSMCRIVIGAESCLDCGGAVLVYGGVGLDEALQTQDRQDRADKQSAMDAMGAMDDT